MAGLKAWDGSAFVDGEPRIWDGSGFVAPSSCHVWDGSEFVKVWPTFVRQRINKNGNFQAPRNSRKQVPGWSSDATYPAVVNADGLLVTGGGPCSVTAYISRSASTDSMTIFVMVGSVEVDSFSVSSSGTTTWTGTVEDGDRITLEVTATGGTVARRTIDGGYVDVIPA